MGEIVNLRQVKKAKRREAEAGAAAANRALHGRTRAEREATEAGRRQTDRVLDGAKLIRDGEAGE